MALVADDEPALRDLLCELLGRLGFEIAQAGDGMSALRLAQGLDRLELVVSDLRMPQLNGLELGRRVRAIHAGVGIVLLSGEPPATPVADRGLRIVRKPFEWSDLRDAVLSLTSRSDRPAAALEAPFPAIGG
jgi:CheY-like chemotaxis protein